MCTDIFLNFFHFSYLKKNSKNVESLCLNKNKKIFFSKKIDEVIFKNLVDNFRTLIMNKVIDYKCVFSR